MVSLLCVWLIKIVHLVAETAGKTRKTIVALSSKEKIEQKFRKQRVAEK